MSFPLSRRLALPWWSVLPTLSAARLLTLAIICAYLLPGLVGHDPWKQDEGYTFGMVLHILESGDWVVPTLGGEPFMEKPPLYYLVAAATARFLSPFLPLHEGARLASLLFIGTALGFATLTARRLFGEGRGTICALFIVGSIGFAQHSHEMITDTALFAGFAVAIYGLSIALTTPRVAGAFVGTGVGVGFMSKGLVEPAMIGLTCLCLPILFREWRRRTFFCMLAWAALFALPWMLIWPIALYHQDHALFLEWFWTNNFGRYFGFANLGADTEPWYYTRVLPWFTLPAGPIALWALFRFYKDRVAHHRAGVHLATVLCICIVAVLGSSATARSLYAMPLLIPVSLLACTAIPRFPNRWGSAATLAIVAVAGLIATIVWAIWAHGVATGAPPHIGALLEKLPAHFHFVPDMHLAFAGAAVTSLWIVVCLSRSEAITWLHRWTASIALIWGLAMTLMLPWIDAAKSFREPFLAMADRIPIQDCVHSAGLGENQRGMLHYFAGIKTVVLDDDSGTRCPYLIVQVNEAREHPALPDGEWKLLWNGSRPGEADERFFLFESQS